MLPLGYAWHAGPHKLHVVWLPSNTNSQQIRQDHILVSTTTYMHSAFNCSCWVTTAAISNIPAWFGLISWYIWLRCITRELMHACKFADVSSARWSRALGTNTWMISSAAASPFWLKTAYSSCRYEINELSNLYTSLWSQLHDLRLTCTDQFISIPEERYEEYRRSSDFIKEYIFPGGCLPSLARITSAMSAASRLWYASSSLVI